MKKNIDIYTVALANAWNTLDVAHLKDLLAEDFHYSSFWVLSEIKSANEYIEYLSGKFASIKRTGSSVSATVIPGERYIKLAQDNCRECGIILCIGEDGKISRADMMPIEMCI